MGVSRGGMGSVEQERDGIWCAEVGWDPLSRGGMGSAEQERDGMKVR